MIVRWLTIAIAMLLSLSSMAPAQTCVEDEIDVFCEQFLGLENELNDFVLFKLNCKKNRKCHLCLPNFIKLAFDDSEGNLIQIGGRSIKFDKVDIDLMKSSNPCMVDELFVFKSSLPEKTLRGISQSHKISYLNPVHVLLIEPKLSSRAKKFPSHWEIVTNKIRQTEYFKVVNKTAISSATNRVWSFGGEPNFRTIAKYLDPNYRFVMAINLNVNKNASDYMKIYLWDRASGKILSDGCQTASWNRQGPKKVLKVLQRLYLDILVRDIYAQNNS